MEKVVNLQEIYRELKMIERDMVTKAELNSALESVMVASNEDTMKQIRESERDIKEGRTKKITSINDIE